MSDDSWQANVARIRIREEMWENYDEQACHKQFKPLLISLRLLGCFPVDFPASGE